MRPLLFLLLLSGTASAADDPVITALETELQRSVDELSLPDAEGPYHVAYDVYVVQDVNLTATLGGLVSMDTSPQRLLGVGIRVGSPTLDNSNFQQRWEQGGWSERSLVLGDAPFALRRGAWLTTDGAYKAAVENLARKQAWHSRLAEPDDVPDYAPSEPHQVDARSTAQADPEALAETARAVSGVFKEYPDIELSTVHVATELGYRAILDSDGTRVVLPAEETDVRIHARARAADGRRVDDHASWIVRTPDQLPDVEEMQAAAHELGQRLTAWRDIEMADDEYVGPVLFEGAAAADLFKYLLVPGLGGTPAVERPNDDFGPAGAGGGFGLKRRILPSGFDVVDDPQADPSLASSFAYDVEGNPAQAVPVIEGGVVKRLLMSQTPTEDQPETNGHARGFPGEMPRAAASHVTVKADKPLRDKKLRKQAFKLAAEYDLDHVLVVRRIADPSLSSASRIIIFGGRSGKKDSDLPAPVEAVRLYRDGREEPVRGLVFASSVDRRILRDIAAAGTAQTTATWLQPPSGSFQSSPLFGFATTVTAPDVLISEVELVPDSKPAERPPPHPSPLALQ